MNHNASDIVDQLLKTDWSFPNESGGNGLYSLHPYPAKFIPQIPRTLINDIGVAEGGVVFDPFCGSGTTLIEAQSLGYNSVGIDLNPIACLISKVATTHQPIDLMDSVTRCVTYAKTITNPQIRDIPNIDHWFKKPIQKAIAAIIFSIDKEISESTKEILRLALSSTIVRVSNQDSDTRYAAIEKDVSYSDVFDLFYKACLRYVKVLPSTDSKLPTSKIFCRDVLKIKKEEIGHPVGLVVCSPPYPNAYEYWLYHKYRMWWLGFDPLSVKDREIGARPHYFKKNHHTPDDFRIQMADVFSLLKELCINNSYACFVLGDSKIHGKIIDNTKLLRDAAVDNNFETVAVISRNISLSRKTFNLANSRLKTENLVIFQKRRAKRKRTFNKVTLCWHQYRYLPYEKRFAIRELAALPGIREISLTPHDVSLVLSKNGVKKLNNLVYFSKYKDETGEFRHTLQAKLENGYANNGAKKRQSTRYSVHGLHEYKGKFNPQVVRGIINAFRIRTNAKILDPFCGSGTTLIESVIGGYKAVGWDKNPFAVFLTNAKLAALRTDPRLIRQLAEKILASYDFKELTASPRDSISAEYLKSWFSEDIYRAIEAFRGIILRDAGALSPFFLAIISDLLRDYSLQEPSDLRIRRRKSPMPNIPFCIKVEAEFNKKIDALEAGMDAHGSLGASAKAVIADCREWQDIASKGTKKSSFDFALTSPPYATALPYIDTQRLSLIWLGLLDPASIRDAEETLIGSREARKSELISLANSLDQNETALPHDAIEFCKVLQSHVSEQDGFRRKAVPALLYRYFVDMKKSFDTVGKAIKPKGIYALVVGTNRTTLGGTQFHIDTPKFLAKLAEHSGWSVVESHPLETYKRYGIHAANSVQDETLLVLKYE